MAGMEQAERKPPKPEQVAIGKRVEAFRRALGMTQDDVARSSDGSLDRVRVSKLESGEYQLQSDKARVGLAGAFGLTLDDLYDLMQGDLSQHAALRRSRVAPKAAS